MSELWIATGNVKKRRELERLLAPLGVTLRTLRDAPAPFHVEEDQPDFAGNARVKAAALATMVGAVAMGDDSGLCVDALDGRPGVHSARYAGPDATDADRVEKLLRELRETADGDRTAHFVCSLCLCGPDGAVRATVEERCAGSLLRIPRGDGGFGYDPVFVADEHRASDDPPSFAELSAEQKDHISHRGKALRRLSNLIAENPTILDPGP